MTDAIVIGAGVGGLAAAIALGSAGMRVRVLEAGSAPGGKAACTQVEGIEVDTGPSVLTMVDVFDKLLAKAGMRLRDEVTLLTPTPSFRYLYPDGAVVDVHHALADTLASVEASLGAGPAAELADFMRYAEGIWRAAAPVFVYGQAPTIKNVLSLSLGQLAAVARIDPWHNMRSAIEARVKSPHLRMLLSRYATYNGSDLRRAPATLNCISHVELALGGYGVRGGMYELVRALVRAAEAVGVVIQCGARVTGVQIRAGAASGVELDDGTSLSAKRIVANADVAQLVQRLLPPRLRHGIEINGEPSMSGFNAIIRARRRRATEQRVAHTVLFCSDYEEEFADIFDRDRAPRDPTLYVCAQEVCHGRAGWPEDEPLFVMANAPAEPQNAPRDPAEWQALRAVMLAKLRTSGLIDGADDIVWQRTPTQLAARFVDSRGSLYGAASNGPTAAFKRPANAVRRVPGLFLASGSAHPGGGVPMAALSGQAAAAAVLGAPL